MSSMPAVDVRWTIVGAGIANVHTGVRRTNRIALDKAHPIFEVRMDRVRVAAVQTGIANRNDLALSTQAKAGVGQRCCGFHDSRGNVVRDSFDGTLKYRT